jgi:hypothetical protein
VEASTSTEFDSPDQSGFVLPPIVYTPFLRELVFVLRLGPHGLTKTEMSVIYVLEKSIA